MTERKEHLTRRVILGYLTLIILAVFAVMYIFNLVSQIAGEKNKDNLARQKVYIVTNILSLLYEGETYTQFSLQPEAEFENFNLTMDKVQEQVHRLRSSTDSSKWDKIDRIIILLSQKRENTKLLLGTIQEMSDVYKKNISKEMDISSTKLLNEIAVQQQIENQKDTLLVQRERKGFFKRLAEAFVPTDKGDTAIHVNVTSRVQTDSIVNVYNPADTITQVLLKLQRDIAMQHSRLNRKLMERTNKLRSNNSVIANEINRVLLEIEEEEIANSHEEERAKQEMIHTASRHLAVIAVVAIVLILVFLYLTIRDISRSRYYRRQLEKAKQYAESLLETREKLMLTISHDIRAPLSSILGYIRLLLNNKPEKKQREYLDNMTVSTNHIFSLVNDLLDFHRLESGRMEIHPVPFHIHELFNEIYSGFKPLADVKKLEFDIEFEGCTNVACLGDTVRIRQALGNLLSNAIKFTSEGWVHLKVSTEPITEDKIILSLSVKDSGTGIAEAEQKKIFGEFTRLSGAEQTDGFGLGLSITGKLVILMDGNISLTSEEGRGSEFVITLPLEITEINGNNTEESPDAEVNYQKILNKKINCLLIDDDIVQIKLTEELLKQYEANVIAITNPRMAVELLKNASFDIILTDIQMPGLDGYELLDKIRSSGVPGMETIPVIALSASIAEGKKHYKVAGFTGFLNKPFTSEELIHLFKDLLPGHFKIKNQLNITSLLKFASEDKQASDSILKTFSEETQKNISLLQDARAKKDRVKVSKLAHKMIPLFKMIECDELVEKLRLLETNNQNDEEWQKTLCSVIILSTDIISQINTLYVE